MKQFYLKFTFILFLAYGSMYAQEKPVLPKSLTQAEREMLPHFQFRSSQITPSPTTPVRAAAEWEEVEYLVVTWQPGFQNILRQIVAVGVTECKVIITTQDQASVSTYLSSFGIPLTNVIFLNAPWDSIWIRDYGGNTIYSNDVGERAISDWIYNRPRPNDNVMPSAHSALTGIPIYITDSGTSDLVNTGGNYMSDGLGNAFASELILDENIAGNPYGVSPKTEAQIDDIMFNYMGIDNYIKMPTLPFDQIHHIDMHMKLLDEETLLVSRYPSGVADGPQIEANIDYISTNFQSAFGTPYDIKWIDAPPSTTGAYPDTGGSYRTFSNSVFVNKSILVPVYRAEVDAPALALYQQLLPGYNVVGIDVDNPGENIISQLGAIHCITHTIGVSDPLLIVHQPIDDAIAGTNVTATAMIKHISGIAAAKVFWREAGTIPFNEVSMALQGNDDWTADIPVPASGTDIEYYIWAQANSGKSLTRPLVAPNGFWTIDVQTLSVQQWADTHISAAYPNPARESVNFKLDNIDGPVNITVTNLLGQKLLTGVLESGNGNLILPLDWQWNGTLLITFEGQFGSVTKKIIKL